jgi:hypothetical protein
MQGDIMTDANTQFTEVLCDFCGGYLRKAEGEIYQTKESGIFFNLPEEHTVGGKILPPVIKNVCLRCVWKALEKLLSG